MKIPQQKGEIKKKHQNNENSQNLKMSRYHHHRRIKNKLLFYFIYSDYCLDYMPVFETVKKEICKSRTN